MKNFKFRLFFFLMPALLKWFQKVLAMKKTCSQCYRGLKQPKIVEKCHFWALLSHLYGFWRILAIWIWNGYRVEILNFWGQNMKKNIKKFTGLVSTQPKMYKSYPSFFMFLSQKPKKCKFWKENDQKSWIFDFGTLIQIVSDSILS